MRVQVYHSVRVQVYHSVRVQVHHSVRVQVYHSVRVQVHHSVRVQAYLQAGPEGQQGVHEVAGDGVGFVHVDVQQQRALANVAHHRVVVLHPTDNTQID